MTTTDNDNWVSKTILVVPKRSQRVLSLHKSRLMKKQGCNSLKSKVAAMVKAQPELKVGGLGRCSSFSKRPFSGSSRSFSGVTNLVQQYLFPTCQVRVVRFYVSLFSSSASASSSSSASSSVSMSCRDSVSSVWHAGPQLRSCEFSVACRTPTAILQVQCGVPDPNRDPAISVWRPGPQPRSCEFSVASRTPTAILWVQCGVPDLKYCVRKFVRKNDRRYVRKNDRRYVRRNVRKICQKICQKSCQKIGQKECQKICQKECQKICQEECQKISQN